MRAYHKKLAIALVAVAAGLALAPAAVRAEPETTLTASGLKYTDVKVGTGAEAQPGKTVSVHYTGWLYNGGTKGKKFDSSRDRGEPFDFPLGGGQVIQGWDEGVAGMKVGGKRTLVIPPNLGYGQRGAGSAIPGGATLLFDVELIGVK
ncbi:MAG: peptidylprolyl isomerase [Methylocystis sp.]|nr:MAG: peptidylprolyl isomerase [Methylocystis sp.]